ncbi:MAG: hypothetical protein ACM3QU_07000 [Verrucomicrobiota bacterium]
MRWTAALLVVIGVLLAAGGTGVAAAQPAAPTHAYGARSNSAVVAARLAQAPSGFTGGAVTAADGEQVAVYVQNELAAADPSAARRWADMVTSLVHGPEIATIQIYVASLDRVQQTCGAQALGCYANNRLIAVASDLPGITARAVLTHEYGHHVAESSDNAPWPAVDYGPKRWATAVGVCNRTASGELAPGDEGSRYTLNPGEAFAEDYRLLNERRLGLPETFWGVVDQRFYPDQAALDAVALDVTNPWRGPTTSTFTSSFTPRATGRGFRIATPLDGTFRVTLASPANTSFTLRVVDPSSGSQLGSSTGAGRVKAVETSVCGQRTLQVQVKRQRGSGSFSLAVARP